MVISMDPSATTIDEAYKYLTQFHAAVYCEILKKKFLEKYHVWNDAFVKAEINVIEKFIKAANTEDLAEAFAYGADPRNVNDKLEYVYLRLSHGYYKTLSLGKYPENNSNSPYEVVARVYGEYFLFYEFLKALMVNNNLSESVSENTSDSLSFIHPDLRTRFGEVEIKATANTGRFDTAIRCAAFCELLYEKKYINNTKTRIVTMTSFAKKRYGIDIKVALGTAANKKDDRMKHKQNTVKGLPPLKNSF